jgi:predicted small metal-binding protein
MAMENQRNPGNTGQSSGDVRFRCSDVGQNCPWEVRGHNEAEIMPKIEQHGREKHNIAQFDSETRDRVRGAIRRAA